MGLCNQKPAWFPFSLPQTVGLGCRGKEGDVDAEFLPPFAVHLAEKGRKRNERFHVSFLQVLLSSCFAGGEVRRSPDQLWVGFQLTSFIRLFSGYVDCSVWYEAITDWLKFTAWWRIATGLSSSARQRDWEVCGIPNLIPIKMVAKFVRLWLNCRILQKPCFSYALINCWIVITVRSFVYYGWIIIFSCYSVAAFTYRLFDYFWFYMVLLLFCHCCALC